MSESDRGRHRSTDRPSGASGAAGARFLGGGAAVPGNGDDPRHPERPGNAVVEEPAKIMRLGVMIRALLEEVRAAPLDDPSRDRLRELHGTSIKELERGLSPELRAELRRLSSPFSPDTTPSDAELRIAHAQLVGWLEGLFHGIQTALVAQQMAARAQLDHLRRGLPRSPGEPARPQPADGSHGMYL